MPIPRFAAADGNHSLVVPRVVPLELGMAIRSAGIELTRDGDFVPALK
jgi:hypothetical protein